MPRSERQQFLGRPAKHIFRTLATASQMTRLVWKVYPIGCGIVLLCELLQSLIPLANAWLTKTLFDILGQNLRPGLATRLPEHLIALLGIQAGVLIVSQLTRFVNEYFSAELGRRVALDVQLAIYRKINSFAGIAPFENAQFHDTIQLASQGAQQGPQQVLHGFKSVVSHIIMLVSFLSVLILLNPLLAAVVCISVLPQLYNHLKMSRQRYDLAVENSPKERWSIYYSFVLSNIQFAKELRLFNLADHFLQAFLRVSQAICASQRRQHRRELRWRLVPHVLSTLISSVAFVVVVLAAYAGRLSLGDVLFYTSAVGNVQGSLSGLILEFSNLYGGALFYHRFNDLLALPQPLPITHPARPAPPLAQGIELRNVSFRYSDQHPWILRDIDLCIPAGRSVALVGLNGAGKTTLVKLLTRLYDPTEGVILWDGIDIRAFDPAQLRQRIGAIFQDFVHYDLSAHDNVGLGDITRIENADSVRRAAIQAGVHEAIMHLPQGYQTLLSRWLAGDGPGADLSGGEWQKIAIARMFMRPADLVILDEPTAALDAQAEYDMYSHFTQLVQGRTSLLISHRFSTVRMADIIAVLEDGRVTEYGSHDELFSLGSTYTKLYSLQAERYR